ncbi:MAG: hypothetical protein V1672_04370 [Candidatus Diapherotrites archaeon]
MAFSDLWTGMKKKRGSEFAIPKVKWPHNTQQAHNRQNRLLK